MNREGVALLGLVIGRIAGIEEEVRLGNCETIAVVVNQALPQDLQITPANVFEAVKDWPEFPKVGMNAHILRARIDANPVLYSARLNADEGGMQAILNELARDPALVPPPTMNDVRAAMALRVEPKPERIAAGAATLLGKARIG